MFHHEPITNPNMEKNSFVLNAFKEIVVLLLVGFTLRLDPTNKILIDWESVVYNH